MDPRTAERLRALVNAGIDWEKLFLIAVGHGMVPLLYRHLNATCPDVLPCDFRACLRSSFHSRALHNVRLVQILLELLDRFGAHGIRAIPFKGPVLALWVYGDLSLRQAADLDLLIHPEDVCRARDLVLSLGYSVQHPLRPDGFPLSPTQYEFRLVGGGEGGIVVELRWRLMPPHCSASYDIGLLWERCEPAPVCDRMVPRLPPEDLLLILCIHGTKHFWDRLMWVCDIAELVRAYPDLDWERVYAQAGRLGSRRMLALGLALAQDLLGVALPTEISRKVQAEPIVRSLVARLQGQFERGPSYSVWPPGSPVLESLASRRLFALQVRERLPDRMLCRLHWMRRRLAPRMKDRALLPLPVPLHFLYYLVRPMRVAGEYGRAMVGRLCMNGRAEPDSQA